MDYVPYQHGIKPLSRTLYRAGVMGYWRLKPPETYPANARNPAGLPILPGTLTPEGQATLAERNATRRKWGGIWALGLSPDPFNPSVRFNGMGGRSPQDWTNMAAYGVKTIYETYNDRRNQIINERLRNARGQLIDYNGNVVPANRAVWAHPGSRAALLSNNAAIRRQAEKRLREDAGKEWHKARAQDWDREKASHFYTLAKKMEAERARIGIETAWIEFENGMLERLDTLFGEMLEYECKELPELK